MLWKNIKESVPELLGNLSMISESLLFKSESGKIYAGYYHANGCFYNYDKDSREDQYVFPSPYWNGQGDLTGCEGVDLWLPLGDVE